MEANMTEENIEQANKDFETSEKPQEQDSSEITDDEALAQAEDVEIIESTDSIELVEDAEPKEDIEQAEIVEPVEAAEQEEFEEDFEITAESVVEAVLFASDESLSAARLADIVETVQSKSASTLKTSTKNTKPTAMPSGSSRLPAAIK